MPALNKLCALNRRGGKASKKKCDSVPLKKSLGLYKKGVDLKDLK